MLILNVYIVWHLGVMFGVSIFLFRSLIVLNYCQSVVSIIPQMVKLISVHFNMYFKTMLFIFVLYLWLPIVLLFYNLNKLYYNNLVILFF